MKRNYQIPAVEIHRFDIERGFFGTADDGWNDPKNGSPDFDIEYGGSDDEFA